MATRKSFSDAFSSSYGKGGFAEGMELGLKNKIAKETAILERKQELEDFSNKLDMEIAKTGGLDLVNKETLAEAIEKQGIMGGINYKEDVLNKANAGNRLENKLKTYTAAENFKIQTGVYPQGYDPSEVLGTVMKDIGNYSGIDSVVPNITDTPKVDVPVPKITTPTEDSKPVNNYIKDLSTRGIKYTSTDGKVKFTKSALEKQEENDAKVQEQGYAAFKNALSEDAKSLLEGDKGYFSMLGQVYSLSSYINAREVEIDAAGLTGSDKVKAVKAWINSTPWLEKKGFERTGAIPGSTGFTILRTVPNITGSKQGLAAMAKMITPSFPKAYTEKGYSDQMLVQSVDDAFRFKVASKRTNLYDNLGYKRNKDGQFIIPDKPSKTDEMLIRDAMEKVELTEVETELLETMKQFVLDAPPAKLYSTSPGVYGSSDDDATRLEALRKKYGRN